jgi:hypothetical protein
VFAAAAVVVVVGPAVAAAVAAVAAAIGNHRFRPAAPTLSGAGWPGLMKQNFDFITSTQAQYYRTTKIER